MGVIVLVLQSTSISTFALVALFCISLFISFFHISLQFHSDSLCSRRKLQKEIAPGCHLEKSAHTFRVMSKFYPRPQGEDSEESNDCLQTTISPKVQKEAQTASYEILLAIQTLSDQVGALNIEQQALEVRVNNNGHGAHKLPTTMTVQGNKSLSWYVYVDLTTLLPRRKPCHKTRMAKTANFPSKP